MSTEEQALLIAIMIRIKAKVTARAGQGDWRVQSVKSRKWEVNLSVG